MTSRARIRFLQTMIRASTAGRSSSRAAPVVQRSIFSATRPLWDKKEVNVPTMGDSITEGTIVEWTASIGQAVKENDVIAQVETDKVTVDIKAEMDGVIVEQFGDVDDTVEVGAKLYTIDTDAEATAVAAPSSTTTSSEPDPAASTPEEPVESPAVAASATAASHRSPSIHFLGKLGWANRLAGHEEGNPSTSTPAAAKPTSPAGAITLDGSVIDAMYGRVAFEPEEMEALIMGGANITPAMVTPSGPAVFAP